MSMAPSTGLSRPANCRLTDLVALVGLEFGEDCGQLLFGGRL